MKDNGFVMISNDVLEDERLSSTDVTVYNAVCYFANSKSGSCFVSQPKLAKIARVSKWSVIKSIKHLEELGYLEVIQNERKDGSTASNSYVVKYLKSRGKKDDTNIKGVSSSHPGVRSSHHINKIETNNKNKQDNKPLLRKGESSTPSRQKALLSNIPQSVRNEKPKKMTQKEKAFEKITKAQGGIIRWDDVSYQDFRYYYEEQHEAIVGIRLPAMTSPVEGGIRTKAFREDFLEYQNIAKDEACEIIDRLLDTFRRLPSNHPLKESWIVKKHGNCLSFDAFGLERENLTDIVRTSRKDIQKERRRKAQKSQALNFIDEVF